jgi:hypothetical protein
MGGGISKHQDEKPSFEANAAATMTTPSPVPDQPIQQQQQQQEEASTCPMHNSDGSYNYDWKSIFRAATVHGPKGSKPLSEEEKVKAMAAMAGSKEETGGGGGCPVKHNPVDVSSQQEGLSGCPVKAHPEYNVYSQPIDKTNNMPKGVGTQLPNPTQTIELSTERVSSTIPKGGGGTDGSSAATTWTYPSPQQFYNALSRKGKFNANGGESEVASEEDMTSVVALHNNMNEKTWAKVVEWERQTYSEESAPKLLKFCGRPHDLAPKAALKHYLLGHPLPYDRHDWTVLRNDGTTVRYVIDYYYDETRANLSEDSAMPELHDRSATPSLLVDVRPALDGPGNLFARAVQMPFRLATGKTKYEILPLRGTVEMAKQVKESIDVWASIQQTRVEQQQKEAQREAMKDGNAGDDNDGDSQYLEGFEIDEARAKEIALTFAKALGDCTDAREAMENCTTEEDYPKASMDLTMCFGKTLCQVQHQSLVKVVAEDNDAKTEAALQTLTECVMLKAGERRIAREQHPHLFEE